MLKTHPVLTCEQAHNFEQQILGDNNEHIRAAMRAAGEGVANGILRDFSEFGAFPNNAAVFVIAGKGHNAGDALIAAETVLDTHQHATLDLLFALGKDTLRPNVSEALARILSKHGTRTRVHELHKEATTRQDARTIDRLKQHYDLSIDGLFGMTFKPPFSERLKTIAHWFNETLHVHFRAAVDLPSGLTDHTEKTEIPLRADATYATGIIKTPALKREHLKHTGRIRYIDIGFFKEISPDQQIAEYLLPQSLQALRTLRRSDSDKRTYGHLLICAGSRSMPGALLMTIQAALRSGAGLLTVCAPQSIVSSLQGFAPEAMWLPMPETDKGGITSEAFQTLEEKATLADALLLGPGMAREKQTQDFLCETISRIELPTLHDADALHPKITDALAHRPEHFPTALMTPHAGEFKRIAQQGETLTACSQRLRACLLLKGAITEITDGKRHLYSTQGGPALARGGAGDILSGLAGGLLAQFPHRPLEVLCLAQLWHGSTAEHLAQTYGTQALRTTDLIDHLHHPLRHP